MNQATMGMMQILNPTHKHLRLELLNSKPRRFLQNLNATQIIRGESNVLWSPDTPTTLLAANMPGISESSDTSQHRYNFERCELITHISLRAIRNKMLSITDMPLQYTDRRRTNNRLLSVILTEIQVMRGAGGAPRGPRAYQKPLRRCNLTCELTRHQKQSRKQDHAMKHQKDKKKRTGITGSRQANQTGGRWAKRARKQASRRPSQPSNDGK